MIPHSHLKHKLIAQFDRRRPIADQQVDHALHHPRRARFTRMHARHQQHVVHERSLQRRPRGHRQHGHGIAGDRVTQRGLVEHDRIA